jgi:hypothetical protein
VIQHAPVAFVQRTTSSAADTALSARHCDRGLATPSPS